MSALVGQRSLWFQSRISKTLYHLGNEGYSCCQRTNTYIHTYIHRREITRADRCIGCAGNADRLTPETVSALDAVPIPSIQVIRVPMMTSSPIQCLERPLLNPCKTESTTCRHTQNKQPQRKFVRWFEPCHDCARHPKVNGSTVPFEGQGIHHHDFVDRFPLIPPFIHPVSHSARHLSLPSF